MQPLGGSKELLPLGWCEDARGGQTRLRAISEYLVERMLAAGADRLCFVVAAEKADLLRYYAQSAWAERVFFVVQPRPRGLCDAVFRAAPLIHPGEPVLIGLPDTVWHPLTAFAQALTPWVHLITFPVANPEEFDAVIPSPEEGARVLRVEVKAAGPAGRRVWGAITAPGAEFLGLAQFWRQRQGRDQYLGDLLNAWIAAGHGVSCDRLGTHYWDVGTPAGYARALGERAWEEPPGELALPVGGAPAPRREVHAGPRIERAGRELPPSDPDDPQRGHDRDREVDANDAGDLGAGKHPKQYGQRG